MNKLERFYEENGEDVILETGEVLKIEKLVEIITSVKKDDTDKRKREGLKKLKALKENKKHFSKEKEGRIFGMIYEFDYGDKLLNIEQEGLYSILRKNIQLDGSGFVVIKGVHTRMQLAEYCGISKNKISKLLAELEGFNLIKVLDTGRNIDIYINPYYYRVNRWCDDNTIKMFNLDNNLFD